MPIISPLAATSTTAPKRPLAGRSSSVPLSGLGVYPTRLLFQGAKLTRSTKAPQPAQTHWLKRLLKVLTTPFYSVWQVLRDLWHGGLAPVAGLETPYKRRDKATDVINDVFPDLVALLKVRDTDPQWRLKLTQQFNKALSRHVSPRIWVNMSIDIAEDKSHGVYEYALKRQSIRESLVEKPRTMGHYTVDPSTLSGKFTQSELDQKRFYCGHIGIELPEYHDTPDENARLYNVLIHETSHLMRGLGTGLKKHIQQYSQDGGLTTMMLSNLSYALGWRLFMDYLKTANIKDVDLQDLMNAQKYDTIRPQLPMLLEHFKTFAKQPVPEEAIRRNFELLDELDKQPKEKAENFLAMRVLDECEAHLSSRQRYTAKNRTNPTNPDVLSPADLASALSGFGFQLIARRLEDHLKIPVSQRSALTQEAFFG